MHRDVTPFSYVSGFVIIEHFRRQAKHLDIVFAVFIYFIIHPYVTRYMIVVISGMCLYHIAPVWFDINFAYDTLLIV